MDGNEVVELDSFIVHGSTIEFNGETVESVLCGKYRVLKEITNNDTDTWEGNLYIVHEKFADESIPLDEYYWQKGGRYDYQEYPVSIRSTASKFNPEELGDMIEKKIADNMVEVVDNGVYFCMLYADYGYRFNVLKKDNDIIGFNITGVGSWINTPQRQLESACRVGNIEEVRTLLTHTDPSKKARLNYEAFYWAAIENHYQIIKYLLSSPELETRFNINDKSDNQRAETPMIILCHTHPETVQKLIFELPSKQVDDIQDFLNTVRIQKNLEFLQQQLNIRQAFDRQEQIEQQLPAKETQVKIKI